MSEGEQVEAPGWTAIDDVCQRMYPGQTPHQFASERAYDLDGPSPLPAIAVYEATEPAHWHYITYGLSELFEKTSKNPDMSGFGFELTLRLPREPEQATPPTWPIKLLQGLGHYVLSGHGRFDSGACIALDAPLVPQDERCKLRGLMCVPDPRFGKTTTPFGSLLFLMAFGLTEKEVEAAHAWTLERSVGMVRALVPSGVTDPYRAPFADDPELAPTYRRFAMGVLLDQG